MNRQPPDSSPLIELALAEFDRLWAAGMNPTASDFRPLFQGDDLADFIELIYHEFCRLEAEERSPEPAEFLLRHAEFAPRLEKLFNVHFGLNAPDASTKAETLAAFPECGDLVGPFQLLRILGKGMQGKAFLAQQTNLGDRLVVVKISRFSLDSNTDLQARLTHPNIMPVLQQFQAEHEAFNIVVMPYRPGASLDQLLLEPSSATSVTANSHHMHRRSRPLPRDFRARLDPVDQPPHKQEKAHQARSKPHLPWACQVAEWGALLAEALYYAYQQGVIHGDIKPGNIYLDTSLTPFLLDFHLARRWQFQRHRRVLNRKDPGGTLYYLPPERLRFLLGSGLANRSFAALDVETAHRSDIYGLGLVLLELLTGLSPAQVQKCPSDDLAETAGALLHWREHREFLRDWPGYQKLPHRWRSLLEKLLAPEHTDRFADGGQLAEELRQLKTRHGARTASFQFSRKRLVIFTALLVFGIFWGTFSIVSIQRAAYWRAVQSHWNMPDYFRDDPSETQEIRFSTKLKQSRLQLEPILNHSNKTFIHESLDWLTKPRLARLDAEIWLMDRLERLTKVMTERALITKNQDDISKATDLLQFAIRRYNALLWHKRHQQLTGKEPGVDRPQPTGFEQTRFQAVLDQYQATLDENPKAEQAWKELVLLAPESFSVRYGHALFLIHLDKGRDAMEELKAATAIDPNHFDSLRLLAYCEMDHASYASALAHLDKALNLRPDDISALRLQAICRVQTGQRAALIAELSRIGEILEENPEKPKFEINQLLESDLADDMKNQDVFDLKTVERLAELIPNDVKILDLLMHKYAKLGKLFDAIATIEKIKKLRPDHLEDKINHAILCFSIGQMDLTYRLAEEIVNDNRIAESLKKNRPISRFMFDTIKRLRISETRRARNLCKKLLILCERSQVDLGECHFLMAKLILETEHEAGAIEAMNHLILSGQQNDKYLRIWYKLDPVFQKYHALFDDKLSSVFPTINLHGKPEK